MKKTIIAGTLFSFLWICLLAENPVQPVNKNSISRGKKVYKKYCLPCHQQDGSGAPRMNSPLGKSPFVNGQQIALIKILLQGLKSGDKIDGETYANPMPEFGTVLKDQQIADVLTYIRNSFGNKASAVTALDVKRVRAAKKK